LGSLCGVDGAISGYGSNKHCERQDDQQLCDSFHAPVTPCFHLSDYPYYTLVLLIEPTFRILLETGQTEW
jgi:hypothetical protein